MQWSIGYQTEKKRHLAQQTRAMCQPPWNDLSTVNRLDPVARRDKGLLQVLVRMLSTAVLRGLEPHLYSAGPTQGRVACQRADNSTMPNDSRAKLTGVISLALHTETKPSSKVTLNIRAVALDSLSDVSD